MRQPTSYMCAGELGGSPWGKGAVGGGDNVPSVPEQNQRGMFRQAINANVEVKVDTMKAPIPAMLMDVSGTGCRLRSVISIGEGSKVSLEWKRGGLAPIPLRGKVAAKRRTPDNALYEYGIDFASEMREGERDKVVNALMELQRRAAINRALSDKKH